MNAIPRVSQAPINVDPASTNGTASADSAARGAGGQGFAAALSNAGSKPARKPAANKAQDNGSTGGQLPAPGNHSPSPTSPVAAAVSTAAGGSNSGAMNGSMSGTPPPGPTPGPAPGSPQIAIAQANAGAANSASAPLGVENAAPALTGPALTTTTGAAATGSGPAGTAPGGLATAPGAAFGQVLGTLAANPPMGVPSGADPAALDGAPAVSAAGSASGAGTPTAGTATQDARVAQAVGSTKVLQPPKSPDAAGGAEASARGFAATAGAARPPVGAAALAAANAATNAVTNAAANAATSAASAANGNSPPAAGASTGPDATAQTATAAAMAAAATGVAGSGGAGSSNGADSSSSSDDVDASAAAGGAHAAAAANGASAPTPAVSMLRAAAASATAAASAETAAKLATASVSDKHALAGIGASPLSPASGDAAAGAASLSVNATSAADATPMPTVKVTAGVDTPEFGQGLADRVSWMVDNNLNGAKLQVNPPQLGPIEVRISVQGDHAQVWLASHSALTRDALESSSPKLREMLGAQGFAQVSVDISQRSFQERSTQAQPYDWTPSAERSASTAAVSSVAASMPRTPSGAVDAYA
jgi:flagellar hook-length control protein FliK